jgi:hypothetical protein
MNWVQLLYASLRSADLRTRQSSGALAASKARHGTATSSAMAELKALGQTVNDVLDIRLMLRRMDLLDTKPSVIWCDSQAAIAIIYRAELNATRSYPRNVRIMHVRDAVDNGDITIR